MHELSIAEAIVDAVKEQMIENAGSTLKMLNICVGELAGVEVESLRFLMGIVLESEGFEDAEFTIRVEPAVLICSNCGEKLPASRIGETCPKCSEWNLRLTGERAVMLESMEIEDEDQP